MVVSGDVGDRAIEFYKYLRAQGRNAELRVWIENGVENFSMSSTSLQSDQPGLPTRASPRPRPRRRRRNYKPAVEKIPVPTVESRQISAGVHGYSGYAITKEPTDEILVGSVTDGKVHSSSSAGISLSPIKQVDGFTEYSGICKADQDTTPSGQPSSITDLKSQPPDKKTTGYGENTRAIKYKEKDSSCNSVPSQPVAT